MSADKKPTALITGASYGIGAELARIFAREGYDLILTARSGEKLRKQAEILKNTSDVQVNCIVSDLSCPGAGTLLFEEVMRLGLEPEVLVNNAGVGLHGFFIKNNPARVLDMIRLNVLTLSELTHLFLPGMLARRRGGILNVASTAAFQPGPLMAVYYATKAYVLSFTEALHYELKGSGLKISTLCPGPTRSHFQENAGIGHVAIFTYASMEASTVAEAGYRGFVKGKSVVIPGLLNKCMAFSVRFTPRWLIPMVVHRLQEERQKTR